MFIELINFIFSICWHVCFLLFRNILKHQKIYNEEIIYNTYITRYQNCLFKIISSK